MKNGESNMSRLIINYCNEESITPNDLMILFAVGFQVKGLKLPVVEKTNSIERLQRKQLINSESKLTTKGLRFITDYSDALSLLEGRGRKATKNVNKAEVESTVNNFIEEYRMLFKDKKPGAMGDKKGCGNKMVQFFEEYKEYANVDTILKATKRYIDSVNDYTYIKQADYFIYKDDKNKQRTSMLASFCEEIVLNNGIITKMSKTDMI